ncbi:MAG: thiazole synthase [Elusimicrobiales bacterium]|nr:thiazole synthase [Elusimicrobiales bacterium]
MEDTLIIAGHKINSRFLLGTGKFSSNEIMKESIKNSETHILTVALRRIDMDSKDENIMDYIPDNCIVMTNTSGARNSDEAIRIARLARQLGCGDWIKIEVISDNKYLLPDNAETIKATEILAKEGFIVMPYFNPDLADAARLRDAGAASIMPLGAPIGTNKGLCAKEMIRILIEEIELPVIVDAGIGRPSQAAEAMELGADAVLVNTAVAGADNPPLMAKAFSLAVKAGRCSYLSGPGAVKETAQASSPLTGFLR